MLTIVKKVNTLIYLMMAVKIVLQTVKFAHLAHAKYANRITIFQVQDVSKIVLLPTTLILQDTASNVLHPANNVPLMETVNPVKHHIL